MHISIDNRSGLPIYEQIYRQIKQQILNGSLAAEELLPSIRSLAKDLRISVITTKRAYEELEREGFLYTVAGKGSFVAPKSIALLREESLRQIEAHLQEICALAHGCGLRRDDLIEMLDTIVETEAESA